MQQYNRLAVQPRADTRRQNQQKALLNWEMKSSGALGPLKSPHRRRGKHSWLYPYKPIILSFSNAQQNNVTFCVLVSAAP